MMKHSNLFEALPKAYYDTAFLDRIHCYLPGWEVQKLRNDLFTDGYGFIVDYIAEVLKELRKEDYSLLYSKYFELSESITTRDRTGVLKTFSGLCKIIYPDMVCSKEEIKELLEFAIEGRKRVKNQLTLMDETFGEVSFSYTDISTQKPYAINTLEEKQYKSVNNISLDPINNNKDFNEDQIVHQPSQPNKLAQQHRVISENEKGISYEKLFGDYLKGATQIKIFDPYIRHFYQIKNLMELLQMILKIKSQGDDISVHLTTKYDDLKQTEIEEKLNLLKDSFEGSGIEFTFEFDQSASFHARSIETDNGWKIILDRGLDIYQSYDFKNPFNLANNIQEERFCKGFEITIIERE